MKLIILESIVSNREVKKDKCPWFWYLWEMISSENKIAFIVKSEEKLNKNKDIDIGYKS